MSNFIINPYAFSGLLLDRYTGAAAAYSVRKLSNAYTGSALRVRRSNDNTEQDIGFDSSGNLDESALTTFVGANSGYVTKWYDQSGNTRDMAQATSASQPRIVNAGTVDKDGSNVCVNFPSNVGWLGNDALGSAMAGEDKAFSIFSVSSVPNTTVTRTGFCFTKKTDDKQLLLAMRKSNTGVHQFLIRDDTDTLSSWSSSTTYSANTRTVISEVSSGLAYQHYRNGSKGIDQTYNLGNIGFNTASIGAINRPTFNQSFDGKMQEIVMWTSDQSSSRSAIETDINTYFSIY